MFYTFLLSLLLLPKPATASQKNTKKSTYPIQGNIEMGSGFESNVFLSTNNTQSDSYILIESTLNNLFQPNNHSILFTFFSGSHQRFSKFDQSNRSFAHLTNHYRYRVRPSIGTGFTNTVSYTNLKLLDTEGQTLPIDQFKALSDQIRLYTLYSPIKKVRLELGTFYQFFNVEEVSKTSLDYQKAGFDISSRLAITPEKSVHLKYKSTWIAYDERQAMNRNFSFDGQSNPTNPDLKLKRHEFYTKLKHKKEKYFYFKLRVIYRINEDLFQDHLSYRQGEIRSGLEILDRSFANIELDLTFRDRQYTDRKNAFGSQEDLKEAFYIADLKLTRNFWKGLWASISYQLTRKTSNDPSERFNNHKGALSFKAIW